MAWHGVASQRMARDEHLVASLSVSELPVFFLGGVLRTLDDLGVAWDEFLPPWMSLAWHGVARHGVVTHPMARDEHLMATLSKCK